MIFPEPALTHFYKSAPGRRYRFRIPAFSKTNPPACRQANSLAGRRGLLFLPEMIAGTPALSDPATEAFPSDASVPDRLQPTFSIRHFARSSSIRHFAADTLRRSFSVGHSAPNPCTGDFASDAWRRIPCTGCYPSDAIRRMPDILACFRNPESPYRAGTGSETNIFSRKIP